MKKQKENQCKLEALDGGFRSLCSQEFSACKYRKPGKGVKCVHASNFRYSWDSILYCFCSEAVADAKEKLEEPKPK